MTGADMGLMPMSPVRRKMAMALQPDMTQPAQMMANAAGGATMARNAAQADGTANEWTTGGERSEGRVTGGTRDFNSFGDYLNDPEVRNDWSNLAGMAGVTGMFGSAFKDLMGLGEQHGPNLPGGGLGQGGMADDLAAFGGVDPSGAQVASGPEPSSPGMFSRGGMVTRQDLMALPVVHQDDPNWDSGDKWAPGEEDETLRWNNNIAAGFQDGGKITNDRMTGPDPEGPDSGYVAVRENEVVLTPEQLAALPPEARTKIARMLLGK